MGHVDQLHQRMCQYFPGYWRLIPVLRKLSILNNQGIPPGHFYSPLPDLSFVEARRARLFDRSMKNVPGIDTNEAEQLQWVESISTYYDEISFTDEQTDHGRYYFNNIWFSYGDAIVLYGMLRHLRPRRIIEVGSGFSSAVMLDTNDRFLDQSVTFTFIEPNPERLYSLLNSSDRASHDVRETLVQDVPLSVFTALKPNDILFIDSSHVVKAGSDVVHLLTHVLPALEPGVFVHVHDVFWPFEYPEEWIRDGKAWNENYVLKAFLQFNQSFKIVFFNSYLGLHHADAVGSRMPLFMRNMGGSLWLRRVATAPV